ncbi:hypothetical protein [Buchnera aphidicola]|uniref:hypothetical protein n=1 Tax=Buchnera aphidicola TaxID=9 RepID=UPI00346452C7
MSDLGHILNKSHCGANINLNQLPISKNLINNFKKTDYLNWALCCGEDYELCFTISKKNINKLKLAMKKKLIKCKHIGYITSKKNGFNLFLNNKKINFKKSGFNHFN